MLGVVGTAAVIVLSLVALLIILGVVITVVLVAWLRTLWREFRRTPVFGSVARGVNMAGPAIAYRDVLRKAPLEATSLTLRIQRKVLALEGIKQYLGTEQVFRVQETSRRYLPDTMAAYRTTLVATDADQRTEASRMLVAQLSRIDSNLDEIAAGAGERGIAELKANGAFLDELSTDLKESPQLPGHDQKPTS
jgi:hypothetical protein